MTKNPNEVKKQFFGITVPPRSEEGENRNIIHPTSNSFAHLEDIQEINYLYAAPEAERGEKIKAMNWIAGRDTAAKLKVYAKEIREWLPAGFQAKYANQWLRHPAHR